MLENMERIETISAEGNIIAIIIRHEFEKDGIEFFTPGEFSQQLAYMKHKAGHTIQEHIHVLQHRDINYTLETLFVKQGRVRINFFTQDQEYFCSREIKTGDVILLASGGHGFDFLEETEMFEVKQGPYSSDKDKVRFEGKRK
jgi:hypothetical protein